MKLHRKQKCFDDSCIPFCVGKQAADLPRYRFFSNRISKISNQISNGITSSEQLDNFAIAADIFIRATLWYWLCVVLIVAVCRSLRVLSQAGIVSKRVALARHGWFLPRDAMLARYMLWRRVWLWARRSAEIDRCTAGGEQQPQRMRAVPRHQLTHDAEQKPV